MLRTCCFRSISRKVCTWYSVRRTSVLKYDDEYLPNYMVNHMIRDPFYDEIIRRLNGQLDPDLFEQCACDILRSFYPTLVPVRGGSDSGMDGAVSDLEGEPYPLIATTSEDVIGNLRRNLMKYVEDGGTRRKAILATSQRLTRRRQNNLEKQARELGFILADTHEQSGIANLLYHNPRWYQTLLGLTGEPSALSTIPKTSRPLKEIELIGREADCDWVLSTKGDKLLIGQPGSGKTYLLYCLAKMGKAYFVVDKDIARISAAIRVQNPELLIVDDAQTDPDFLETLRLLRLNIRAKFEILATSWEGDRKIVEKSFPEAHAHTLELLTRSEIAQIVKVTGLYGPPELIYEIINQAEGRAGLAVTLAHSCLFRGDASSIFSAESLLEDTLTFYERGVEKPIRDVLACFSIGGKAGMEMASVCAALSLNVPDVRNTVVRKLAAGGIVRDVNQDRLAVQPAALRHALVRDVFFDGAQSLPDSVLIDLIRQSPNLIETVITLIGARIRGANVPSSMLISLIEMLVTESLNIGEVLEVYARIGKNEASWALTSFPEHLIAIAKPCLHFIPDLLIPKLLDLAASDRRALNSHPDHPFRIIEDWIKYGLPSTPETIKRRSSLLKASSSWLLLGGNIATSVKAFTLALSPEFERQIPSPETPDSTILRFGFLSVNELEELETFWKEVGDVLAEISVPSWDVLIDLIHTWAYPSNVSDEVRAAMYIVLQHMIVDISALAKHRPGVLQRLKNIATDINLDIEIEQDFEFGLLFPSADLTDSETTQENLPLIVRNGALHWGASTPIHVIKRFAFLEDESKKANITWPNLTYAVAMEIAELSDDPLSWVKAILDEDWDTNIVVPFLRRSAEMGETNWASLAVLALSKPIRRAAIVEFVLTLPNPPQNLLETVWVQMDEVIEVIRMLCVRGSIPEKLLGELLRHPNPRISSAAALGEWNCSPKGDVRPTLRLDWQNVIVSNFVDKFDDHWLQAIFKKQPTLGYRWLVNQVTSNASNLDHYKNAVEAATANLSTHDRTIILDHLKATYWLSHLISCLVGEDLDIYSILLSRLDLSEYHFAPLFGDLNQGWIRKTKLALGAGYTPEQIVGNTILSVFRVIIYAGKESERWANWTNKFEVLCSHDDKEIAEVAETGRMYASQKYAEALSKERRENIYGTD
jgi:hypothetical protein